jgi:hypothetical protein
MGDKESNDAFAEYLKDENPDACMDALKFNWDALLAAAILEAIQWGWDFFTGILHLFGLVWK